MSVKNPLIFHKNSKKRRFKWRKVSATQAYSIFLHGAFSILGIACQHLPKNTRLALPKNRGLYTQAELYLSLTQSLPTSEIYYPATGSIAPPNTPTPLASPASGHIKLTSLINSYMDNLAYTLCKAPTLKPHTATPPLETYNPPTLRLPEDLFIEISKFIDFIDFRTCTRINRYFHHYYTLSPGNPRRNTMAKSRIYNVITEIVQKPLIMQDHARRELFRRYQHALTAPNRYLPYLRYHEVLRKDVSFCHHFTLSEVKSEFELLFENKAIYLPEIITHLDHLAQSYRQSRALIRTAIQVANSILGETYPPAFIFRLLSWLFDLEQTQHKKFQWICRYILRTINQYYQFPALFRWISTQFDENFDLMGHERRHLPTVEQQKTYLAHITYPYPAAPPNELRSFSLPDIISSADTYIQSKMARSLYEALPFSTTQDDLPICYIPKTFSRDLVMLTLLAGHQSREIHLEARLAKFNELGVLNLIETSFQGKTHSIAGHIITYQAQI